MTKNRKPVTFLLLLTPFIFLVSCSESKNKIPNTKAIAPAQIISIAQAKNMYNNYSKRRLPLIQHYEDSINKIYAINKEFDVARFISYDYKTIKQYLAYIEEEAKNANVEISTLRFYFSNYPDQPFFNNQDSILHPRQNSIILSPTIKKKDRDYLFYIEGIPKKQEAILLNNSFEEIKGIGQSKEKEKSYAATIPSFNKPSSTFYTKTSLTMNRGQGTPPPKEQ